MAANLAEFNNYLTDPIGITDVSIRTALNEQGLDGFDELVHLSEKDITSICANARKPGGTIDNPNYDPQNPVAGVPTRITNPGVLIGTATEKRLKMLWYYVGYLHRVQRAFSARQATLNRLTTVYKLKEQHDETTSTEKEIPMPEKLATVEKVRQILENIDHYLQRKRGISNLPLAYVVRDSVQLPDVDPGFGLPDFASEMIARGPHTGPHFEKDNATVWNLIRHVTHEGPAWSWVQSFQRTSNGRSAYMAMKQHYLGESFSARLRAHADQVLDTAFYDGKSRSFTFEKYCEVLKSAFTDIESTNEEVSETRKVRILLQGIADPRLQQAKSQVLATAALKETYDTAVNFISQFLDEKRSYSSSQRGQHRNISAMPIRRAPTPDQNRGGRGRGGRFGQRSGRFGNRNRSSSFRRNPVTEKYYTPEEWSQLSLEDQQKVRDLRSQRDRRRNVQSIDTRNIRPRIEDSQPELNSPPASSVTPPRGIGATMSQRVVPRKDL